MTHMQVTYESARTHESPTPDSDGVARTQRQTRRPGSSLQPTAATGRSTNTFTEDLQPYSQDSNSIDDSLVRDTHVCSLRPCAM